MTRWTLIVLVAALMIVYAGPLLLAAELALLWHHYKAERAR